RHRHALEAGVGPPPRGASRPGDGQKLSLCGEEYVGGSDGSGQAHGGHSGHGSRLRVRGDARHQTRRTAQDDAVMAGASGTQTVAAADGRMLAIAECGDPDGFPVFLLHGTPGSRFAGQSDASAYANVGARVITYDRPGYGGSDRFRGRRFVDCVADVSAIADSLGVERFAVIGGSSGGPPGLSVVAP